MLCKDVLQSWIETPGRRFHSLPHPLCQHALGWTMARETVGDREIFFLYVLNFFEKVKASMCVPSCTCLLSSWGPITDTFPPSQTVDIVSGFQGKLLNLEETCDLLHWPGTHTILSVLLPEHHSLVFCCLCGKSKTTRKYRVWFHGSREHGTWN